MFFLVSVCCLFPLHKQNYCDGGSFLVELFPQFELCFLSNTQARDENESRITRLHGGKSFFQKLDAKPRAALGSIANTLVERNAAGKVSGVSTSLVEPDYVSMWFPHTIADGQFHSSPRIYITPHHPYTSLYAIPLTQHTGTCITSCKAPTSGRTGTSESGGKDSPWTKVH